MSAMDDMDFVDVGGGWFLYDDRQARLTVVCDALSEAPDCCFGPQAWQGRNGPLSGLTILEARAVLKGRWEQVGRDVWKWFSEDGQEFDEPPSDWPRIIEIKEGRAGVALDSLSGRTISTNAELAELLRAYTRNLPQRDLPCVGAGIRMWKHIDFEIDSAIDCTPDDDPKWQSYRIQHRYDLGDQSVTVEAPNDFDARTAAVYMQFMAEEWFGSPGPDVTNLGIAAALVSFYGCKHAPRNEQDEIIDMYSDRAARCSGAAVLMADTSMRREGLREFLAQHLDGR